MSDLPEHLEEHDGDSLRAKIAWQRMLADMDRDEAGWIDEPPVVSQSQEPAPWLSPWVIDRGPGLNRPEDERAIRREEDRITQLDREGR